MLSRCCRRFDCACFYDLFNFLTVLTHFPSRINTELTVKLNEKHNTKKYENFSLPVSRFYFQYMLRWCWFSLFALEWYFDNQVFPFSQLMSNLSKLNMERLVWLSNWVFYLTARVINNRLVSTLISDWIFPRVCVINHANFKRNKKNFWSLWEVCVRGGNRRWSVRCWDKI